MSALGTNRNASARALRWGGVTALALAVALVIAACGGGDDNSTTSAASDASTSAAAGGGGGQTVNMKETDFKLNPSDPTVKAGTVRFDISNDGQTLHSLEVEGPSGEKSLSSELQPGDSGTLQVDLNKPGKYEFYCPVDGHRDMGMQGEITVQ